MTPIKINGQSLEIPSSWDEVTVGQFIQLRESAECVNPVAKIISALTGIEYETIESMKCDVSDAVLQAINFVGNVPEFSKMIAPDKINIGGTDYDVIKDISEETFGQKIMMQQKINEATEAGKDLSVLIPFAIATYFQPIVFNEKYSGKKAEQFETVTSQCKIIEAFPVANFFLSRCIHSQKKNQNNSTSAPQQKKFQPELKD